jgi:hypothetical protein
MVCGIHTRKSRCPVPRRNKCGGERIEYHYRGKEEGHPWLVGPAALSAGTLEERLVLSPAIATFAKTHSSAVAANIGNVCYWQFAALARPRDEVIE